MRKFLLGLSLHTQSHRFFAGVTKPSASMMRALLARDERRDSLVAVVEDRVIGHAMAFRDGLDVEIAVVVTDEWQGVGVGSQLVRTLLGRVSGAEWVAMDVMGDNRKVLAMVRRAWPDAIMTIESGSVQVRAELTFAEQGSVASPLTV
ncbi:GNAT family N-acetyltransferase [Acrocarpospora macrocephala]|uniref:GNAT family N-acetyltransferase n=1 Tax=Acrocarpospora macrocephala TaxID=150177 RepID=UPI001FE91711|nr:GNAT family N-acetyltransferase [Acrocarpospora macrocephala]